MTGDGRGEQIQQLFLHAARLPVKEREEWLCDQCAGDPALLDEVRSLLEYDNLPQDPLESGLTFAAELLPPVLRTKQESPTLPGYRIMREIGTGGQAIVYEAIQESTTQRVALKVLRWGEMASSQEHERLRREVLILARLRHPGIVSVIDSGETDSGVFFVATQFVDGRSLEQLFGGPPAKRSTRSVATNDEQSRLLGIFVKICNAVQAAHDAGVVHRDLKPANILLDGQNEPRVLDFGLAKSNLRKWFNSVSVDALTVSGQFMGSLPWASPEQAEGKNVDVRSDIYSLGIILYQLISGGEFPYDVSGNMQDVITKIIHADPTPLDRLIHGAPQAPNVKLVEHELNAIVMKCLEKCPNARFQSAVELSDSIGRYLAVNRDGDAQKKAPESASGQNLFIAAAVVLSIVACLIAWFNPPSGPDSVVEDATTESPSTPNIQVNWTSFDRELSQLRDGDTLIKIEDGWKIRERELVFPTLEAQFPVVRVVLRRHSRKTVALKLRSQEGIEVYVEISRNREQGGDEVAFGLRGNSYAIGLAEHSVAIGDKSEIIVVFLSDQISFVSDGKVLMQVHCQRAGPWTPVLDASITEIDIVDFHHGAPIAPPREYKVNVVPAETAAVDDIVRCGGAAVSQRDSDSMDGSVFYVSCLSVSGISESGASHFAQCSRLERLKISKLADSSEILKHIAKMKTLSAISILSGSLDGDCFHHLSNLEKLETLSLWHVQLRDPNFRPLQELSKLAHLDLSHVEITNEDLDQLANIKSLKRIGLSGQGVTSNGLESLVRLRDLEKIELRSAHVSGDGMRHLAELPNLTWLDISGSDVSDGDVPTLIRMPNLRYLVLNNTSLSPASVAQLRSALPDCRVTAQDQ